MKIIIATVLLFVLVSVSSIPNSYAATFDCPDTNSFVDSIETMGAGLVVSIVCTLVDFTDIEALIDALDVRVTDNEFDISNNTADIQTVNNTALQNEEDIQTVNSTLNSFIIEQNLNNTAQQEEINQNAIDIVQNSLDIQTLNSTIYPPPPLESSDYIIVELDRDNIEFGDADIYITVTTDDANQWTGLGVQVELVGTTTNSASDLSYLEVVNFVNNTATLFLDGDSELQETGLYRLDTFGNSDVQGAQNTEMYFYYWIFEN